MKKILLLGVVCSAAAWSQATQWNGIVGYGQSLSIGQESTAISNPQPYSNLCLNSLWNGGSPSTLPLVANAGNGVSGGCAIGGSGSNAFESPTVSLVNNITKLSSGQLFVGVAADFGISGVPIATLSRPAGATNPIATWCATTGGSPDHGYCGIIAGVVTMKNLATAAGKTFALRGIFFTQGEADFDAASTTYYSDLKTLQANLQTDIQSITGQTAVVPFIFSQVSSNESDPQGNNNLGACPDGTRACVDDPTGLAAPLVTIAEWKLQHDFPTLFYLAGPKYQYTYASGTFHLDALGYNRYGATAASIAKELWSDFLPNNYAGVFPHSITRVGPTITATFYTPNGLCLASDTTTVPRPHRNGAYDPVGLGFQFFQTGSSLTDTNGNGGITAVSISGCQTMTITLSGTPTGSNQRLAYAFEGERGANTPVAGCSPDATTCNGSAVQPSRGTLHGNIRTLSDSYSYAITQTQRISTNQPGIQGDTNVYTAWSPSTSGGTFNGGRILGTYNDGSGWGDGAGHNLAINEISVYDPVNPANTHVSIVNTMSSFGGFNAQTTLTGETGTYSWKSGAIFYIGSMLYLNINRHDASSRPHESGFIVSPDNGLHWCNYTNYTSHSNTCTSANWQAGGDAPTSTAGMQYPDGADGTLKPQASSLSLIQTCQANTVNCPTIPGVDTSYIYFLGVHFNAAGTGADGSGLHRILKTADPMLVSSWTHWNGNTNSWDSNIDNSTALDFTVATQTGYYITYVAEWGLFFALGEDDTRVGINHVFTSPDLFHWTQRPDINQGSIHAEWFHAVLPLKRRSGGHVIFGTVSDDDTPYAMIIQDLHLGPTPANSDFNGDPVQHWLVHFNEPIGYSWAGYSTASVPVAVTGVTPTHAILTYTAPSSAACTVVVATDAGYSNIVHDTDSNIFLGSNVDNRTPGTSSGTFRQFVVGQRIAQRSDNTLNLNVGSWYSRALQAAELDEAFVSIGSIFVDPRPGPGLLPSNLVEGQGNKNTRMASQAHVDIGHQPFKDVTGVILRACAPDIAVEILELRAILKAEGQVDCSRVVQWNEFQSVVRINSFGRVT